MNKQHWKYKKIGDICDIKTGKLDANAASLNGVYPFFTCSKETLCIDRYSYDCECVLIAGNGDLNVKYYNGKFDAYQRTYIVTIKPQYKSISTYYLYKFFCKYIERLRQLSIGGVIKYIKLGNLTDACIPVPPIGEQERIVAELDLLSGIIEKKKEQLKAYDQLAQSIFYSMFGDVEEDTSVSHYISALRGGKSLAGEAECKNKVLKTGAVTYDYFKGDEVKNLPTDYIPIKEHLLKDGDILISRMNTLEYVGACAYIWKAPSNTYLPDRLWKATLKDNINPIFLWFSLIQDKTKEQIRSLASGTSGSMKNISIPRFLTVKIKCIPLSLQQEFAEKVEAIERQKALVQQSIEETQTMFDYTMDKYFG